MRDKLTTKQELFCYEYVKNLGNGAEAVRKAYPDIKTEGAIRVMANKLVTNGNVQLKIKEIKGGIFGNPEEVIAKVGGKLMASFEDAKIHRDIDKLGRTILEALDVLGGKAHTQIGIGIKSEMSCEECSNRKPVFSEEFLEHLKEMDKERQKEMEESKRKLKVVDKVIVHLINGRELRIDPEQLNDLWYFNAGDVQQRYGTLVEKDFEEMLKQSLDKII